jgi:hypothetical protein
MSAAVMTARTPGRAAARLVSSRVISACARVLRRTLPYSIPGRVKSAA